MRAPWTGLAIVALAAGAVITAGMPADAASKSTGWVIPARDTDTLPLPIPVMQARAPLNSVQIRAGADSPDATNNTSADAAVQTGGQSYSIGLNLDHSTVRAGDPAALHPTATLTNTGQAVLTYSQHGSECAWEVLDKNGTVVWDSQIGRRVPHFVMIRHLAPGKAQTYTSVVPATQQDGRPLAPGTYTLRARPAISLGVSSEAHFTVK